MHGGLKKCRATLKMDGWFLPDGYYEMDANYVPVMLVVD